MRKIISTTLMTLVLIGCASAQYDSLRQIIHKSDSDSVKMSTAYLISRDICHTMPDSGIYYGWMAYNYAVKAKVDEGKASAYSQIGYSYNKKEIIDSAVYYWNKSAALYKQMGNDFKSAYILTNAGTTLAFQGKYDEAEATLFEVKEIMIELDSQRHLVNVINNLGLVYDLKGDYDKGYAYYMEGYKTADVYNDIDGKGTSLNNMSVMYYYKGDYEKTISYGKRALTLWDDDKYLSGRSKAIKNIAVSYEMLHKIDSAIIMHNKAIVIDKQLNNEFGLSKTYNNIGCLFTDQGDIEKGQQYLEKALAIKSKMGVREGIATTYNYLGSIYTKKKDYITAKKYLDQGRQLAIASQSPEDMKDNLSYFAEYHESKGDYKSANSANKAYHVLKDSLINIEMNTKIEELNVKYETAQKDAENNLLTLENIRATTTIGKQKKTIIGGGIILATLGLLITYILKQRNRLKTANQNLTAKKDMIALLNQELNHRVKNNLTFITSLMQMQARRSSSLETKGALQESEHRILALSKVHQSLKSDETNDIALDQYIMGIITNLKTAFQSDEKQMSVTSQIDTIDLDAESGMRLGLIINELITNSMKHVDASKVDININVTSSAEGGTTLKYQDNGSGIERHLNSSDSSKSMGLQLINMLRDQLKGKVDVVLV